MNITVLMGSPRRGDSYNICKEIEKSINKLDETINIEYIFLKDYKLQACKGCSLCFQKTEELCPCEEDDLKLLKQKLLTTDGIIVATPVYAYQVPAPLKNVIDRLSYWFHRQELVAKPALIVVTTDGGGSKAVYNYLKMTLSGWGLDVVGNIQVISTMYFEKHKTIGAWGYDKKYAEKTQKRLLGLSTTYVKSVTSQGQKTPSFYDLFIFNCLRSKTYTSQVDYNFWKEKTWLKKDYFYDVKLNPLKKCFGKVLKGVIAILGARYRRKE